MTDQDFDVLAPWRIEDETPINLVVHNSDLLASRDHFLRFDLYPIFAPAHPERHFGYWDIPMRSIKREKTKLFFRRGNLIVPGLLRSKAIAPVWTGERAPLGYCILQVSLCRKTGDGPVQEVMKPYEHLFMRDDEDVPLEFNLVPITQRCNLFCPVCTRQHGADLEEADLPADVLERVLEAAPETVYVGLQGIGEPLMNKDLVRIATELRRRMPSFGRLALTTNGTLLTADKAANLIDAGLNTFTFSVDGATKPVYESKRVGGNFERLLDNISAAVGYGRKSGREDLWFAANFVIAKDNVHQVPEFVRLGSGLGLDRISFFLAREYPDSTVSTIDSDVLEEAFAEAREVARGTRVAVKFANPERSRRSPCQFMQGVYLWLTGEVLPCHRMEPPGRPWPTRIFGNVREEPLIDIWNRPEYREFRLRVLRGDVPEVCRGCTFNDSSTL